jgi:hypothetical protein
MLTLLKSCTYADSMASSGVQMSSAKYADKFAARSRLTAPRIGLYPLLFTFFQGRTGETGSHRTAHTATQSVSTVLFSDVRTVPEAGLKHAHMRYSMLQS